MTKEQYDFLTQAGLRPHLRGFEYLADFLDIFDKSESKDIRICKEVYGAIAEKREVSAISVERDIRHLIADRHKVINTATPYRIRKLTPLECFRLMGFSDEDFYKCVEVGISNSQLYKQAGNSIVVDVLERIFERLLGDTK